MLQELGWKCLFDLDLEWMEELGWPCLSDLGLERVQGLGWLGFLFLGQ